MSQKVQVTFTCDICGPDTQPLEGDHHHRRTFSPDGKATYEIDLCDKHNKSFDRQMGPFVEHARRAGTKPRIIREARGVSSRPVTPAPASTAPADTRPATAAKASRSRPTSLRAKAREMREWAKAQGYKVAERGRLPANIVEEYERTH